MNINELIIDTKTNEKTVVEKTLTEQEIADFQKSKTEIDNNKRKLEIKSWFEEYDSQVKQYQRCVRLGIEFDKDIVELDNQARVYQEELRVLLGKPPREYEEVVS